VRGPKPRPLTGNILDVAAYVSKSTSKDMDHITHDTVNRLLPHYVAWSKQYGTQAYLTVETTGLEPET
jgi:cytokinin trans-hydroxylase